MKIKHKKKKLTTLYSLLFSGSTHTLFSKLFTISPLIIEQMQYQGNNSARTFRRSKITFFKKKLLEFFLSFYYLLFFNTFLLKGTKPPKPRYKVIFKRSLKLAYPNSISLSVLIQMQRANALSYFI